MLRVGAGALGALGATCWGVDAAWADRRRRKKRRKKKRKTTSKIIDVKRGRIGTTLTLELDKGPFPCPGKPWKDNRTFVFVPHHFRARGKYIDTVLHFHGHGSMAETTMDHHQLREQVVESRQNTILVVPQGPVRAKSGSFGKLDQEGGLLDFLTDLRKTLSSRKGRKALKKARIGRNSRIGMLCLSSHSGGYAAAARCALKGRYGVNEIYLFDSLYSHEDHFHTWLLKTKGKRGRKAHKLVSYYAGGRVKQRNMALMRSLEKSKFPYVHEEREGQLTRAQLTKSRAVFIRTRLSHGGVTHDLNNLRDCLYASCLKRRLNSNWFRNKNEPRKLDRRD